MKIYSLLVITLICISSFSFGEEYTVKNTSEFSKIIPMLKPGDKLNLSAGSYSGGITVRNIKGTAKNPVIIEGAGPDKTIFQNGKQALHLINCHYIILRNFSVKKFSINGINADDGGSQDNPSTGLVFENLHISEIGPKGNWDGLKLSGLHKFTVENCSFKGWGGSAIDMVGCHNGQVISSTLTGTDGYSQMTGIQMKGGTRGIKVLQNKFTNAGSRSINLGGSTGLPYFRPKDANYEAKEIEIAGNFFHGSPAPIAFVGSIDNRVHHNTFILPEKWVFRILQESKDSRFVKCQNSTIEKNIFLFDKRVRTFVNIGSDTGPDTFKFEDNVWLDVNKKRLPKLPVKEKGAFYNYDFTFKDNKLSLTHLKGYGAEAYKAGQK